MLRQGDSGNTFYIVAEGTAKAVRDGNTVMQSLRRAGPFPKRREAPLGLHNRS